MRLFLVIGESYLYQPNFVADFLRKTSDEVIGAALVTKSPPKSDLSKYLIEHFYYLRPYEITKLALATIKALLRDGFAKRTKDGYFNSVRSVFETFDIKYFEVEKSINKRVYLDKIRATMPDVIISSNPLIFLEEILQIPKICCLNRHSSLLPSYGGLWPVFHAVRRAEEFTGASIHIMVSGIDQGPVLSQAKVLIQNDDSVSNLYTKTYGISTQLLLQALDKVRVLDFNPILTGVQASYFSNPTKTDWQEFRKNKGRF